MPLDKKLLEILACPDCHGDIDYRVDKTKETLKCKKCGRVFPVVDGIPQMLPKDFNETSA